jgi:HNH endonuclease
LDSKERDREWKIAMERKFRPAIIRFLEKIRVSETQFFEGTPCWIWKGTYDYGRGYPSSFRVTTTYQEKPYRFAYMFFIGEVPPKMDVHHRCYHPPCCNPLHLGLLSHRENVLDGNTPVGINARKKHCKRGHLFAQRSNGTRYCPTCNREYLVKYRRENPEKIAIYEQRRRAKANP